MTELSDELRFYAASEAAEVLDISPELLRYGYPEMHILHTPEKSRLPAPYVDGLAASTEWQDRKHISLATSQFAGSAVARRTITQGELQLENEVQSVLRSSRDRRISSTSVTELLRVSSTSLQRWRTSGIVPAPTKEGKHLTISEEEFRAHYAWQRPASSPITDIPLTPARLAKGYAAPAPSAAEMLELPTLVRASMAAGILAIDRTTVTSISPRLHRLNTPAPFYQYSAAYLHLLARNITWVNDHYTKDQSAQYYARREEAHSITNRTELLYNDTVSQAFREYATSGVISDHIASHLLGVSRDTISKWRSSGHIHPTAAMTRQHLEELFVWERPAQD